MKILYICPHLSTGGQPQYAFKQLEAFYEANDVYLVEYGNHSDDYVVQKNRIKNILGEKFFTLNEDKTRLLSLIKEIEPEIIHFQEIPEFFMAEEISSKIFCEGRSYKIVCTTHSSNTNPEHITHIPDKFVLVSEWSKNQFQNRLGLNVDLDVWEYPIENLRKISKEEAQSKLGLDREYKHVLNVGLFTPGKNQKEIFEIAKSFLNKKVKFHFVGNQAENFKECWQPLMQNKPENCIIWRERSDTDLFYQAADLFYFSSVLELNPLVVKESLGFGLPTLMRKLETYLDSYDNNPLVTYINTNSKETIDKINSALSLEKDIPGWFSYSNFYDEISKDFHDGYKVVEVGAWLGRSTAYLANKVKQSKKKVDFHTIDTWKGSLNESLHQSFVKGHGGSIFEIFLNNLQSQNLLKYVTPIQDSSQNAAKNFSNNSLDAIMIDADHSYEGVRSDILNWYSKIKPGGLIAGDDYGVFEGVSRAVKQFFHNISIDQYTWKYRKPKIQAIHLRTRVNDSREAFSKISLEQLKNYGIDYTEHINQIYAEVPPKDFCRRPEDIGNKTGNFETGLGPINGAHYGCYLAHRQAIEAIDDNYDYTLIFEADAILAVGYEDFFWKLNKCIQRLEMHDVYYIGLSNNGSAAKYDAKNVDNDFCEKWNQSLAHAYLIPNKRKTWYLERIKDSEWDSADLWFNHIFCHHREKRYTYNEELFKQSSGLSILDEVEKKSNNR